MIGPATRVRLAPKVRLRFDERSGKHVLLYPERGLELSASAAGIALACREETTPGEVTAALAEVAGGASREQIAADVLAFLRELASRGLLITSGDEGEGT